MQLTTGLFPTEISPVKITKNQLKKIIREEKAHLLREIFFAATDGFPAEMLVMGEIGRGSKDVQISVTGLGTFLTPEEPQVVKFEVPLSTRPGSFQQLLVDQLKSVGVDPDQHVFTFVLHDERTGEQLRYGKNSRGLTAFAIGVLRC